MSRLCASCLVIYCLTVGSYAQSGAVRDDKGIGILSSAAAASGSGNGVSTANDFIGTGNITYYWGGQEVQGAVTIKGKGLDQFRLDADLGSGRRSWTVSHGQGQLRETDGTISTISYHNAISLAHFNPQHPQVTAAVHDSSVGVTYAGLQQVEGHQFHDVRISRQIIPNADPHSAAARVGQMDVFIDPSTLAIAGIQDYIHPNETFSRDIAHAIYFDDYRKVNGLSLPFSISEWVNDQKVWSIQLANITLNANLSDSDFQF